MLNFFKKKALAPAGSSLDRGGGWFPIIREPFSGAWQRNIEWTRETVLAYHAIFSCITLIASDISKLRIGVVKKDSDGVWTDVPLGKFNVIQKPNSYQNSIQFYENWIISKLARGNTYALKGRDSSGNVNRLYLLNPDAVTVLVSESGDVFYQLGQDNLADIENGGVTVPANEIIHDRFNCLFHPLIGLSPIFACGLAAYNGLKIQENSANHFRNMSRPGGIITAPGAISDEVAKRLKEHWDSNYSGKNYGKTAVLGDDLKYTPIGQLTAVESQMVEQLKLNADIVCSTFHVPAYKVIGNAPAYNNIEAQEAAYYSQCLQILIESIELCLDEGLELPRNTETRFDLDGLLRMDSKTMVETLAVAVKGGLDTPNEARKRRNQKPLTGGDTVYMQQQQFSLEALAKRDAQPDPFGTSQPAQVETPIDEEKQLMAFGLMFRKELSEVSYNA